MRHRPLSLNASCDQLVPQLDEDRPIYRLMCRVRYLNQIRLTQVTGWNRIVLPEGVVMLKPGSFNSSILEKKRFLIFRVWTSSAFTIGQSVKRKDKISSKTPCYIICYISDSTRHFSGEEYCHLQTWCRLVQLSYADVEIQHLLRTRAVFSLVEAVQQHHGPENIVLIFVQCDVPPYTEEIPWSRDA